MVNSTVEAQQRKLPTSWNSESRHGWEDLNKKRIGTEYILLRYAHRDLLLPTGSYQLVV